MQKIGCKVHINLWWGCHLPLDKTIMPPKIETRSSDSFWNRNDQFIWASRLFAPVVYYDNVWGRQGGLRWESSKIAPSLMGEKGFTPHPKYFKKKYTGDFF